MNFNYPYASPWSAFSPFGGGVASGARTLQASPYGGYGGFRGFGGFFGGMCNWLMRQASQSLGDCWGGHGGHWHRGCRHSGPRPATLPAPLPGCTTPTQVPVPAQPAAPVPAPAPTINAPREGAWNADKGGYIVGQSGQLQIDTLAPHYPSKSEDYQIQYRSAGGNWTDLGTANGLHGKSVTVKADPGSKLEFRINAYGEWQQAGTTLNTSGRDMAKITKDGDGYKMGFENYKTGTDYEDLFLKLSDPKAPR